MSVPLDRLYNHLDGLCNHDALIYRFFPHGSKKLEHLLPLYNIDQSPWHLPIEKPGMLCHDQEPLMFNQYLEKDMLDFFIHHLPFLPDNPAEIISVKNIIKEQHLRSVIGTKHSVYDKTLLLHSEKNSANLEQYEQAGFVGVYWWSHAAISLDWFRYAQHDPLLAVKFDQITHDFLVYNRAWSGTREYRLKFTELVVNTGLSEHCQMKFTPKCNGYTYQTFVSANEKLAISRFDLEDYFKPSTADANSSADYDNYDYQHTAIEVVLETLFDDARWHLTEKSLRPIACGRPFILAATAGSLQYLRSYGFETFGSVIDESYDTVQDPVERLQRICKEMKRISKLSQDQKRQLWQKLYTIAQRNQQLFFSDVWQQGIFDEFTNNFNCSIGIMQQFKTGRHWLQFRDAWNSCPEKFKYIDAKLHQSMIHQQKVEQLLKSSI